ncbi:MAG: uncharacterized protein K0S65_5898 [Labilithrix sp.]|nr:uncharacterized protein [Labilithrix sp.]
MNRSTRARSRLHVRGRDLSFAVIAALFAGTDARADQAHPDETRECAVAYEQTQRQRQRSELVSALESAERCARSSCPALLRDECRQWAAELRPKLPTLVVRVRGADGCASPDATVEVDGNRRASESSGLLVDPGVHQIKVIEPTSGREKVQRINFASGERRDIDVDLAPSGAVCTTSSATRASKIPTVTLVLGSVGAGLVLAGATVGLIGASERSDLDACKPNCARDRIDGVRPYFLAGDVLAGFGILALGAAVVTWVAGESKPAASNRSLLVVGASGVGASF